MNKHKIQITVETSYIEKESASELDQYVFSYTITISNNGKAPAKLLSRHWIITDANEEVQEVRGKGVIGQQPHLKAGESYTYTSGTVIRTKIGFMQGSYQMITDDKIKFDVQIEAFGLEVPGTLH